VTDVSNATAVGVPGATLRYDVVGAGPMLLLIHGGIADSAMLRGLAAVLADRFTVVTYDRRGYGDSPLEDPGQEQSIGLHADDAHRLLSSIATEPADVLGLSSGAFVGLELATQHPEQVRTVVAFEPPLTELLPDRAEFFFAHELPQYDGWLPDFDALRPVQTVIGGGDASGTQPARRAADALAERVGTEVVEFPGDHGGLMTQPDAFAARLAEVLGRA
jgi:pimeloyl-ACP methyl ester carboxylesterase